jgi:hypothetical protein
MALARTITERLALTMLAREGIAVIWQLHLASAEAPQRVSERRRVYL